MENTKRPKDIRPNDLLSPRIFDAVALGQSLRELAADVIQGETTDFLSRWFHSAHTDADLVIWTDSQNRVIKHQLCFFGQVVEWNPIHGTRTGYIREEELGGVSTEMGKEVAETVHFDEDSQAKVVQQAIDVLGQVPGISEDERGKLIYNLRESPKLHKKARERALKAWAPRIDEIVSDQRPSFWRRLKTWVLGE